MANPFDQFDQPQGQNPFNRFDAPPPPPERPTGEQITRGVGMMAQGLTSGFADVIGGPVDLVNLGLKQIGLGSDKPFGGAGTFRDLFGATAGLAGPETLTPENDLEKGLYGGARGVANAAGMMTGAGMARQLTAPGGVGHRIATALMGAPGTQMVASGAGGAVGDITGSPIAGLVTSLGVGAVPSIARAIARPNLAANLKPEDRRLLAVAEQEGIPLTTGQQTGGPLKTLESVLANLPFSGGMARRAGQKTQEAFNRAVMERTGTYATDATPATLRTTRDRISGVYNDVAGRNTVILDQQLDSDLAAVMQNYGRQLPDQQKAIVERYISNVTDKARQFGFVPGQDYQMIRSQLGKQAKGAAGNDPFFADALRGIRQGLDDAMGRSVLPADSAAWRTANREWGNMRTVERAMSGAGEKAATGDISPLQLRNAVNSGTQQGYARGQGDLNDLAHIGQGFMREPPNSGTAQRLWWQNAATGGSLLGGGFAASHLPAAVGALAIPPAIQAALQSPAMRNYLMRPAAVGNPSAAQILAGVLSDRLPPLLPRPQER